MTTHTNSSGEDERDVFGLLWAMVRDVECEGHKNNGLTAGTIIGRHARIIDDRIENSGYSRTTDSLKLYTIKQLKDEIKNRKDKP